MGFFKWFAQHARNSNDEDYYLSCERKKREDARKEAEQKFKDSLKCCANCNYYGTYGMKPWCSINRWELEWGDEYKEVCKNFFRKI